jgi:Type II secretion system (T2SS), protein J
MILSRCLAHVARSPISWLSRGGARRSERVTCQSRVIGNDKVKKGSRARQGIRRSGYLLLEVLLALAVLSISVVMIFKIIQTTLKVTADINFLQTQQRKVDGIYELLRRNFDSMPRTCTFQTRTVNGSLELIFRSAPFNFSWVASGENFGTVVIGSRIQADGRFALSVLQESANALDSYVDSRSQKKADWFPVMNDAERISWRFFDATSGKWSSDWPDIGTKPNLVELTFKLAGRDRIERCVFRWPIAPTGT